MERSSNRKMRRVAACLFAAALLGACGPQVGDDPAALEDVTGRPLDFDGRAIGVEAAWFSSFEVSVLTTGFAGSDPPRPIEPLVWVAASPPQACIQRGDEAVWAERVVAEGTFRYRPEGGFGHLGAYEMTLENATLTCR